MTFFDNLDGDQSSLLPQPAPGPLSVSMSGQGSLIPSAVNTQKRGKKTRIPIHRIKPTTALDQQKLEALSKNGDPSIQDLEDWGINFEVDPSEGTPQSGAGVVRQSSLKTPSDPNKLIQGTPGDIGRLAGEGAYKAGLTGFDVERSMKDRADAEKKSAEAAKLRQEVLAMQKDAAAKEPPQAEAPIDLPSPGETILGAARSAGVPEDDFTTAITQIAGTLGVKLDESVPFPIALMRLLNRPEFAEARPDFEALGSQASQSQAPQQPQPDKDGKPGEQQQQASPQQQLQTREVELMAKLAQSKDIDNWLEAIAFVLLSMLIKPQMAILFFSKASERGELKSQIYDVRRRIGQQEYARKIEQEKEEWNRREAVRSRIRMAEGAEDDRRQMSKEIMSQWLQYKRQSALMKAKPPKDDTAKSLQDDMDNWLSIAGRHAQNFEEQEAQAALRKAAAIHDILRKYQGLPEFEEVE